MNSNLKGMSGVVATALLLVVAVVAVTSFQNFYNNYQSGTFIKAEQESGSGATGVETMIGNDLYFKNTQPEDLEIKSISVDGFDCQIPANTNASANSIEKLNISACAGNISDSKAEVVVVTGDSIYTKFVYYKDATGINTAENAGGGAAVVGDTTVVFNATGPDCPNASFVNIFDYYSVNVSHVTIPSDTNGTRAMCIDDGNFHVSNSCSAATSSVRLFYVGNYSNSHIWFNNAAPYTPPGYNYNWSEICIGSDDTTILMTQNTSDMTALNYSCIASFYQNDTYGGMIGECSGAFSNKIWIKIGN